MAEPDLAYVSRQLLMLQVSIDAVRSQQNRMADDIAILKADIVNMRADMQAGFSLLDSRLRPLEISSP